MFVRRLFATATAFVVAAGTCSVLAAAPASAAPLTPVYVALGDSYSSGEGACKPVTITGCDYRPGTNTATDDCHRSHNAYAVRTAAKLPHGWKFAFAACSGATTANVLSTGQNGEPAQLKALQVGPTQVVKLVTVTLGGNDAGFSDAVARCVTAHLFASSCHGKVTWQLSQAALRTRLTAVYAAVHAAAPTAKVLVLGYPRLFSAKPSPSAPCDVSTADSKAFSKAEDALNASVAAAVKRADLNAGSKFASFVDDGAIFKGHELCAGPAAKSYLNGLLLTSTSARPESFHPNRSGQSLLAARLQKALK
jgi:lysophospholipase L1-like esterase